MHLPSLQLTQSCFHHFIATIMLPLSSSSPLLFHCCCLHHCHLHSVISIIIVAVTSLKLHHCHTIVASSMSHHLCTIILSAFLPLSLLLPPFCHCHSGHALAFAVAVRLLCSGYALTSTVCEDIHHGHVQQCHEPAGNSTGTKSTQDCSTRPLRKVSFGQSGPTTIRPDLNNFST